MAPNISDYLKDIQCALELVNADDIEAIVSRLFRAYAESRTVFTCGNGASAALASHMACDLGKGTAPDLGRGPDKLSARRLRIHSLNDNAALLTAYSNDLAYEDVFVEQLKNFLSPNDVLIGISGSGGSPNVLRAMAYARKAGATTIGLTGSQSSAFKIIELSDLRLQVAPELMEQIEDLHVIVHHIIGLRLRARIADYAPVDLAEPVMTNIERPYINPWD